jgi:hypothetical protein
MSTHFRVKIYGICDPETSKVVYVGRTVQTLSSRLNQHLRVSKKDNHKFAQYLRGLGGLKPSIRLLDSVPDFKSCEAETMWINIFTHAGSVLLNSVNPREGAHKSYTLKNKLLFSELGKEHDEVLAQKYGITRKAVAYHRVKRGIPAKEQDKSKLKPPNMGGWNKRIFSEDELFLFGKFSDENVAKKLNTNKKTVNRIRRELNIPSYAETSGYTGRFTKVQNV